MYIFVGFIEFNFKLFNFKAKNPTLSNDIPIRKLEAGKEKRMKG
jgi:hypothetical protein